MEYSGPEIRILRKISSPEPAGNVGNIQESVLNVSGNGCFLGVPEASRTFPAGSGEDILRRIRISGPEYSIPPSRGQNLGKAT